MATQDHLEIINSRGEIKFHSLDTGRGITNIGRHPDNDIVLDSPEVAPFHAILDHQQRPYRLIALSPDSKVKVSGQLLQPNTPKELQNWDTIELDGCSIVLMETGAPVGAPAPTIMPAPLPTPIPPFPARRDSPASTPLAAPAMPAPDLPSDLDEMVMLDKLLEMIPEDRSDDIIIVEALAQQGAIDSTYTAALDFSVDVEQPATMQLTITNGGDLVGEFNVEVRGLDPFWVAISPPVVNLNEGERAAVSIAITAPRLPSSRARPYYFSVVVT